MKKNTTNKFLIGSWVSFYPFNIHDYEYQLDQMRKAGINFNIFPASFGDGMHDAITWNNVEAQYEARDMYYCMYGGLTEDLLRKGVQYAKGKVRCIGYHLIDEPGRSQALSLRQSLPQLRGRRHHGRRLLPILLPLRQRGR